MSPQEPPALDHPDDVDRVLRSFFRTELPRPWPAFRAPAAPAPRPAVRPFALWRSRLVLAASILLLFLGQFWLAGAFRADDVRTGPGASDDPNTATKPHRHHGSQSTSRASPLGYR